MHRYSIGLLINENLREFNGSTSPEIELAGWNAEAQIENPHDCMKRAE